MVTFNLTDCFRIFTQSHSFIAQEKGTPEHALCYLNESHKVTRSPCYNRLLEVLQRERALHQLVRVCASFIAV